MRNILNYLFRWGKSFILLIVELDVGNKTGNEAKRELAIKWISQCMFISAFISFSVICGYNHAKLKQLNTSHSKAYSSETSYIEKKEVGSSINNIVESSKFDNPYIKNWYEIKVWRVVGIIYILVVYLLYKFGITHADGERIFNVLDVAFFSILITFTGKLNSDINYFFIISILLAGISYWASRDIVIIRNRNCVLIAYFFALILNHFWANWDTKSMKLTELLSNLFQHYLVGVIFLAILLLILKFSSVRFHNQRRN